METQEKLNHQGCRLQCQTGQVLSLSLFPQRSFSCKETIQVSSTASERLLAEFSFKLESKKKDCTASCHQHLRKLGCLVNYGFPMLFPRIFFFNRRKSIIKIVQHSNFSPRKCRMPWLFITLWKFLLHYLCDTATLS